MNRARLALNRAEWASIAFAVIVAHAFLVHEWFYPSAWDATKYVEVARDIADHGMFRPFTGSAVRTYGYPLVLSLVLRAAHATGLPFVVLLFAFQFLAYVAAAFFLRRAFAPVSPPAARIAFCGLLVRFYVLIYASQLAGYAVMRLAVVNSFRVRGGVLFGIAAYVLVAMLLSGWVRDQSQQIREYRAARTKSVGLRGAGDACCAPATDSATREAAFDLPHSHGPRFAG